jgi:mono/diheme cytochrome c family protein
MTLFRRNTGLSLARTTAAVVAAAALFMSAEPSMATEADGRSLFDTQCGQCHGPRDIAYWGRTRRDATARAEWLDNFLKRHYPPPEAERAAIVRYIQETIEGPAIGN